MSWPSKVGRQAEWTWQDDLNDDEEDIDNYKEDAAGLVTSDVGACQLRL